MMRFGFQSVLASTLLFVISCNSMLKEPSGLSDAEIIEMIRSANKIEISLNNIPSQSQILIEDEYYDYMGMASWKAAGLGYEVELAGLGHRSGHRNEIYFDIEGRKLDPSDWGKDGYDRDAYNKEDWQCFDLIYPIAFDMPDGSTITVESDEEDQWVEIKTWYDLNPNSDERPTMQFPVVIFFDEASITINNRDELRNAYSECQSNREKRDGWGRRRDCFDLVYPVTFIMPDGSNMTVNNDEDEDGWNDLKNWYEENSGYEEVMPELQYPVDIVYTTGEGEETVTINSEEEMLEAKDACHDDWEEGYERECFELVLPISFMMPDGSTILVENEDGFMAIRNWYVQNEGYEEVMPELQYPVDIVYTTGEGEETVTINSGEELEAAKRECWEEWDEEDEEECFELVLPVTYIMPDGSTITVEDEEGWYYVFRWYEENSDVEEEPNFQFPVDILYITEDGEVTVTINSEEEMETAYEECEDDEE